MAVVASRLRPVPHAITLALGRLATAAALLHVVRFDGNPTRGITSHTVYVSRDGMDS